MSALLWVVDHWPWLVGGWLALSALAVASWVRAGRVLNGTPEFWRCCECQAVFVRVVDLVLHLEDEHPTVLPRVDA